MRVAFVGNPNVGKSALINAIAGTSLRVGNWPGVTVERKEATLSLDGREIHLVDLPGVYNLSSSTPEEEITLRYLLENTPDVVVNVVDATNLERNLFLTLRLCDLGVPVVVALNMWDEVEKRGLVIDVKKLEELLGVVAIPTCALKGVGTEKLLNAVLEVSAEDRFPRPVRFSSGVERFLREAEELVPSHLSSIKRFAAAVALEGGVSFGEEKLSEIRRKMEEFFGDYADSILAEERFKIASSVSRQVVRPPRDARKELTDLLDTFVLNRFFGLPLFLFVVYLVFKVTFGLSEPLVEVVDTFFSEKLSGWISSFLTGTAPPWVSGLFLDGVLSGVGTVLSFVPMMVVLYLVLGFLEESGYMARAAFVMDGFMRRVGLHGRSFIPLMVGFGCNVPAILATRVLDSERDRKITALLVPFMSCGARLPIYALFAGVFFKGHEAEMVMLMYLFGVAVSAIVGVFLDKVVFKGKERGLFVMELPPYRLPALRVVWASTRLRVKAFLKKASGVIVVSMVVLWATLNLPYGVPREKTLLGRFAAAVSPVFSPSGFPDYRAVAALIPGTVAKEAVVGALAQMYHTSETGLS